MKERINKAKEAEEAIRIILDSFTSHLQYMYGKVKSNETNQFHIQCCIEYAETILHILKMLKK